MLDSLTVPQGGRKVDQLALELRMLKAGSGEKRSCLGLMCWVQNLRIFPSKQMPEVPTPRDACETYSQDENYRIREEQLRLEKELRSIPAFHSEMCRIPWDSLGLLWIPMDSEADRSRARRGRTALHFHLRHLSAKAQRDLDRIRSCARLALAKDVRFALLRQVHEGGDSESSGASSFRRVSRGALGAL